MYKRHRLRSAADFDLLRKEGRRWHHQLIVMVARENGHQYSRFGFSASKRLGKAAIRNRTKRICREIVRHHIRRIEVGWDCLFIVRQNASIATYAEIEDAILELLERAILIKNSQSH